MNDRMPNQRALSKYRVNLFINDNAIVLSADDTEFSSQGRQNKCKLKWQYRTQFSINALRLYPSHYATCALQ